MDKGLQGLDSKLEKSPIAWMERLNQIEGESFVSFAKGAPSVVLIYLYAKCLGYEGGIGS
jgi:hypothetical protein